MFSRENLLSFNRGASGSPALASHSSSSPAPRRFSGDSSSTSDLSLAELTLLTTAKARELWNLVARGKLDSLAASSNFLDWLASQLSPALFSRLYLTQRSLLIETALHAVEWPAFEDNAYAPVPPPSTPLSPAAARLTATRTPAGPATPAPAAADVCLLPPAVGVLWKLLEAEWARSAKRSAQALLQFQPPPPGRNQLHAHLLDVEARVHAVLDSDVPVELMATLRHLDTITRAVLERSFQHDQVVVRRVLRLMDDAYATVWKVDGSDTKTAAPLRAWLLSVHEPLMDEFASYLNAYYSVPDHLLFGSGTATPPPPSSDADKLPTDLYKQLSATVRRNGADISTLRAAWQRGQRDDAALLRLAQQLASARAAPAAAALAPPDASIRRPPLATPSECAACVRLGGGTWPTRHVQGSPRCPAAYGLAAQLPPTFPALRMRPPPTAQGDPSLRLAGAPPPPASPSAGPVRGILRNASPAPAAAAAAAGGDAPQGVRFMDFPFPAEPQEDSAAPVFMLTSSPSLQAAAPGEADSLLVAVTTRSQSALPFAPTSSPSPSVLPPIPPARVAPQPTPPEADGAGFAGLRATALSPPPPSAIPASDTSSPPPPPSAPAQPAPRRASVSPSAGRSQQRATEGSAVRFRDSQAPLTYIREEVATNADSSPAYSPADARRRAAALLILREAAQREALSSQQLATTHSATSSEPPPLPPTDAPSPADDIAAGQAAWRNALLRSLHLGVSDLLLRLGTKLSPVQRHLLRQAGFVEVLRAFSPMLLVHADPLSESRGRDRYVFTVEDDAVQLLPLPELLLCACAGLRALQRFCRHHDLPESSVTFLTRPFEPLLHLTSPHFHLLRVRPSVLNAASTTRAFFIDRTACADGGVDIVLQLGSRRCMSLIQLDLPLLLDNGAELPVLSYDVFRVYCQRMDLSPSGCLRPSARHIQLADNSVVPAQISLEVVSLEFRFPGGTVSWRGYPLVLQNLGSALLIGSSVFDYLSVQITSDAQPSGGALRTCSIPHNRFDRAAGSFSLPLEQTAEPHDVPRILPTSSTASVVLPIV